MAGPGKRHEPPPQHDGDKKPPAVPIEDDEDYEDGDIATPKRDRHDEDDRPL